MALAIVCLLYVAHQKLKENDLKGQVGFIVESSSSNPFGHRDGLSLTAYIGNAQCEIDKRYLIIGDKEWETVGTILDVFIRNIKDDYFVGNLKPIKSKYTITGETYFMLELVEFFRRRTGETYFNGIQMYSLASRKNYYGTECHDDTYELNDFSLVYYKLYLTAYNFCLHSKALNYKNQYYSTEQLDSIKNIIDKKTIDISWV